MNIIEENSGMLDKEQLDNLESTGQRLRAILSNIVDEFPKSARSIAGMSKWLELNRSNSQRILNAVNNSENGKQALCLLPGIGGISDFLSLVQTKEINSKLIGELKSALEDFEKFISLYCRSHSELKRMLSEAHNEDHRFENSAPLQARLRHFESSKELIGESTEFLFCSYILTENPENSQFLTEHAIVAKQGIKHERNARPFFQHYSHKNAPGFTSPDLITKDSLYNDGRFHVGVATDLSSPNLMEGYSGYSEKHACLIFDHLSKNQTSSTQNLDATFVFTNPDEIKNPLSSDTQSSSTAISIKNPTKRLIMMVFMEKKLDRCSSVNVGCYSANHPIAEGELSADEISNDKLPEYPELKVVDLNAPIAKSIDGHEFAKYYKYLFNYASLNPNDFVCYLMDVPYPIWSTCYRIYFEHGS